MESKCKLTALLLLLLFGLGAADAVLLESTPTAVADEDDGGAIVFEPEQPNVDTPPPPPPGGPEDTKPGNTGGVRRHTGPDVLEALAANGFTFKDIKKERVILQTIVPEDTDAVHARILLIDGDRAGLIAWEQSPRVKKHFLILKEALHTAFTPEVTDLLDETQRREGKPTRNLLTFMDPGLVSERVVFIRVRERLYEFHVAPGASEAIFDLIENLTD